MIDGRFILAAGLIGIGAFVLNRARQVAAPVQGLGEEPYTDENGKPITAEQFQRMTALNDRLIEAQAHIDSIKNRLIVLPPMPQFGAVRRLA